MKRLLRSFVIFAASIIAGCQQQPAHAASLRGMFWSSAAANCVSQAGDVLSTKLALNVGARETNPMFVHNGQLSIGTLVLVKAAFCGIPPLVRLIAGKEVNERTGYSAGIAGASVMAGPSAWATAHNIGVWQKQKDINAAASAARLQ